MKFRNGDRIIVKPHFWWSNGGKGVVSLPPDSVVNILKNSEKFNGAQRNIAGKDAIITSV